MLQRMLTGLMTAGIEQFVLVTGYLEHKIRDAVGSWYPDLPVSFVQNAHYDRTNTSASLLLARPFVEGEPFLLLDGDIVCDDEVITALLASEHSDCLALRPADDLGDEEVKAELTADAQVVRIGKPNVPLEVAAGESIGIEKLSPAFAGPLFDTLQQRVHELDGGNELREVAYQLIIDAGARIHAVDVGHCFCAEIDTPEDLQVVSQQLQERAASRPA